MKWSLPLVELRRAAARYASPLFAANLSLAAVAIAFSAGCTAIPVIQPAQVQVAMMHGALDSDEFTDAEKLRLSQLPAIPDFDIPVVAESVKNTAPVSKVAESAFPPSTFQTPKPSQPATLVETAKTPSVAKSPASKTADTPSQDSVITKTEKSVGKPKELTAAKPVQTESKKIETRFDTVQPAIAGAGQLGVTPPEKPSPVQLPLLRVDAPKPFAWTPVGKTTGDRAFQTVTIGDEGYRTVVVGSVAGNDPLAIELVEQLARHLHNGKTILGGFQTTVIRTLNPDGEAQLNVLNSKGQYINHGFPKDNGAADANQPAEVTFLLGQINTLKPQRVIHVRTIESDKGLIAASSGGLARAKSSAEWIGFQVISLPEKAVSGSLERHLGTSGRCEILTFAIPATTRKSELWDRYGDALQNFLMGEKSGDKELARKLTPPTSGSH